MGESVTLDLGTETLTLPVIEGSEGEKAIDVTAAVCPDRVSGRGSQAGSSSVDSAGIAASRSAGASAQAIISGVPVAAFHMRASLSSAAVTTKLPSFENAASRTA